MTITTPALTATGLDDVRELTATEPALGRLDFPDEPERGSWSVLFAVDGDDVVLRLSPRSTLAALLPGHVARLSVSTTVGSRVDIIGVARIITDLRRCAGGAARLDRCREARLDVVVAISCEDVVRD